MPKDEADLAHFLASTPDDIAVHVLGVASNTLIRDGGIKGVVIRLGADFARIETQGQKIIAGAAALDSKVAKAGCYGTETQNVLVNAVALDRSGRRQIMTVEEFGYGYRQSAAPPELIFTQAVFKGTLDDPAAITKRMQDITRAREESQPIREKTGGSTFKNPDPSRSNGRGAWQVIEAAGGRGLEVGGAQMSKKHCNFMINTGRER